MGEPAIKVHPMLFSGPMVRALLDGTKTQTRRLLKPQPPSFSAVHNVAGIGYGWLPDKSNETVWRPVGPVWAVRKLMPEPLRLRINITKGDLVWVKETWRPLEGYSNWDLQVRYNADGARVLFEDGDYDSCWNWPKAANTGNVSPLFLPRWASRLTLRVTAVRVQPLHDITESDAIYEGCRPYFDSENPEMMGCPNGGTMAMEPLKGPKDDFQRLWEVLNGKRAPWSSNPWVVAYSFEVLRSNVWSIMKRPAPDTQEAETELSKQEGEE